MNQRLLRLATPVLLSLYCLPLQASSEFIPHLTVTEYLASNTSSTLDENGQITTLSPGFTYNNTQRRSQLALNYGYNVQIYNGLSNEDTEQHNLSLLYGFTHVPEHWTTQLNGNVSQSSTSADGIQTFNPVLNSNNTRELRTYGVSTSINSTYKQTVNLQTQLLADYADFEDAENTDSIGLNLSLDNKVSQKSLYWNTAASMRRSYSGNDTSELNSFLLGLNYRFNSRYSGYINVQANDTDDEVLNETSTLLGLNWQPDRNNFINAGVGTRGDATQYSLGLKHVRKRLTVTANYSESITSARNELLQQETDETGIINTFQTLSITPVLQKKGVVNLTLSGRKTDVSVALSSQTRSSSNIASEDRQTDALSLSISRKLSTKSSVSFNNQLQKVISTQQNDIIYLQIVYYRTISKNIKMSAEISDSRQKSDVVSNEYQQQLIGISLKATF